MLHYIQQLKVIGDEVNWPIKLPYVISSTYLLSHQGNNSLK